MKGRKPLSDVEKAQKAAARLALKHAKAVEEAAKREADKKVMIEKVINLKLMCDYAVSCSYGDIVLIISMLRDYVNMLDKIRGEDIVYQAYYRKKFLEMADRLSEQIGYNYDEALEKCRAKQGRQEKEEDIGEEAMVLSYKKGLQEERRREEERNPSNEVKYADKQIQAKPADGYVAGPEVKKDNWEEMPPETDSSAAVERDRQGETHSNAVPLPEKKKKHTDDGDVYDQMSFCISNGNILLL